MWTLPLVSMLGVSGSAMFAYSSGVFMEDVTREFGWTRAQFSSAFVLQMAAGFFILPLLGRLADRIGPRRVILYFILPFAISFSLLGTANGTIWMWLLLSLLVAATQGAVGPTIWVTGVAGRFKASRGLAIAVTLAGLSMATFIWPILAATYIKELGWRLAFPAMAFTWAAVVLPLAITYYFGPPAAAPDQAKPPAESYVRALKSPTFIGLMIAGGLFASAYFGAVVHLVPILRSKDLGMTEAASIAGLVGLSAMVGRLGTGFLLDRLPTRPIALVAFLLLAVASTIMLNADGSMTLSIIAIILLGLSSGAEMDVITFISARRFGQEIFASVYGVFTAIISICASTGPILAGALFDQSQSYDTYLMINAGMAVLSAAILTTIPVNSTQEA